MSTKYLVGVGALAVTVMIGVAAQLRPERLDRGGEWLSWSQQQRATYVDGFITGYLQGSYQACESTDELFEVGKPHRLGNEHHPSEIPSARCLVLMEKYSKATYTEASGPNFNAYTDVITEFYTKHPEYRSVPFVDLMKSLGDHNYMNADRLYQMALKGEIHPLR